MHLPSIKVCQWNRQAKKPNCCTVNKPNESHQHLHAHAHIILHIYFVFQSSEWFCANEKMWPFFYAASHILKVLLAYTVDALFWFLGLNSYNLRWHTLSELNERGLFSPLTRVWVCNFLVMSSETDNMIRIESAYYIRADECCCVCDVSAVSSFCLHQILNSLHLLAFHSVKHRLYRDFANDM